MPKIKYIHGKKKEPPPVKLDYITMMLGEYMRRRKITYQALGEKIGKSPDALRVKKHYGSGKFKVDDLFTWCKALDVEEAALLSAVSNAYREARR